MAPIIIEGNQLESSDDRLTVPQAEHVLVKLKRKLDHVILDELDSLKVKLHHKIGNDIWLCHNPTKELSKIKGLDFVDFAVIYHPFFKIQSLLRNLMGEQALLIVTRSCGSMTFLSLDRLPSISFVSHDLPC